MAQHNALPERPPAERIQDILDHRDYNLGHFHMRYDARRDYLQLCAEIDHLRASHAQAVSLLSGCQKDRQQLGDRLDAALEEVDKLRDEIAT